MAKYQTYKEILDYSKVVSEAKTKCKICGCTKLLTPKMPKAICHNCGNYIFLNKQEEFKHRLKEAEVKRKRKAL